MHILKILQTLRVHAFEYYKLYIYIYYKQGNPSIGF